ncbi:aminoglycoside phosphotransferase family protein [Salipaludibacillus agaradhaerens]|uniref:phosphotransferase family protein n=1 Tax=Salipaludibacillus agaradhaerens TaxID=76935 RepID=UPI0021511030|nr:aminoglycoside phosphotransferase family protein [Salipaludibacillus agaradhaerens]MCR6107911.1 aminoglycoside phosphotransferase family protein [Salipaludibacillus agaradhaerens]MCR6119937.1 aminoglycoside phosphotransferase family protein [Salipaludibacillus agaradhaerens]
MDLGNPIATGNTAKIYYFDNKIVKVFNDFLPDTESVNEANKHKYAYSSGLPVPEILGVTKINGKQAIIMEYVKGKTLGDLLFKDKEQTEYYLNISIDIQIKIHSINPNPKAIEPMYVKLNRQIETVNKLGRKQKSVLLNKLESFTYENRLCHGDFHLYNLIKTDNQVVVIDWVDSSAGDIRADVYRTYLLYSQVSFVLADMYLRLYCEKSGILRSEVFQWAPVIAGARLSESVSTENSKRLMRIINHYCPL